jgi:N-acetylglucosamine malate deacetylase 1
MTSTPLDILAIAAHRDDVEQTCGGTLLKAAQRGQRTGILDLTQGEMGTRGTPKIARARRQTPRRFLGVVWRRGRSTFPTAVSKTPGRIG